MLWRCVVQGFNVGGVVKFPLGEDWWVVFATLTIAKSLVLAGRAYALSMSLASVLRNSCRKKPVLMIKQSR
jgi:hypothetical protein